MVDLALSDGDVADLEALTAEFRPDDWVLETPNETADDGHGGYTTVWEAVTSGSRAAGTGARIEPAGYQAREQILAEQPKAISAWTIYLPIGTPVMAKQRIVIGGRTFHLTGTGSGGADSWAIHVQVGAAEVQ